MAIKEHIDVVHQGARAIALWREQHEAVQLDLSGGMLRRLDLVRANLNRVILRDANLEWADFRWADLIGADLSGANLARADFHKADMATARLSGANLSDANLEDANCRTAEFTSTLFYRTRLLNTDLSGARGLAAARHSGPSLLDPETIGKSGHLPREFLTGCGLNENAISAAYGHDEEALASTLGTEGDYFSCFISYSARDEAFVEILYRDLQERGVRCWFAPEDMKIWQPILDTIYGAIRQREKLLLVFSEHSVESSWVRDEVERAFAEERNRRDIVVFPIMIDDTVMLSDEAWARKIRDTRHIGDFREWGTLSMYRAAFERLLRDLKKERET